jgi:gamma-glutamyltranspeptidase/glutathione hydrolase
MPHRRCPALPPGCDAILRLPLVAKASKARFWIAAAARPGGPICAARAGIQHRSEEASMSSSTRNGASSFPMPERPRRPAGPAAAPAQGLARAARRLGCGGLAAALLALAGCGTIDRITSSVTGGGPGAGQQGHIQGFLGGAAADEPRAALLARDVLSAGGSATDAAVAAGFGLTVTLPSRAGLGGGGACLVYDFKRGVTEALMFLPPRAGAATAGADRPAAVPMMARGLFALHSRNPRRPFEELVAPAEQLARFGTATSRALAQDLAAVSGPLFADPAARAIFSGPGGQPLTEGNRLTQADLSTTLAAMRIAGVGDLHQGALARRLAATSPQVGGPLLLEDLRPAVPVVTAPLQMRLGNDIASFLPVPADGGLAGAAAFQALQGGAAVEQAARRGLGVARAWRDGRGTPEALLAAPPADGAMPGLPASTSLVTLDRDGNAVSCAFTLNNLFGTGRILPQMGFLLAAAPGVGRVEPPLLSAMLVHNPNLRTFRYAGAASGQEAAPIALALPAARHLLNGATVADAVAAVPEPGRANAMGCSRYLPGAASSCGAATDPRGAGLAVMSAQ